MRYRLISNSRNPTIGTHWPLGGTARKWLPSSNGFETTLQLTIGGRLTGMRLGAIGLAALTKNRMEDTVDTFQPLARSLPPPTTSLPALAEQQMRHAERQEFSIEKARLLFGQFRKGEANDAATYVTSIAAVLVRYSQSIVLAVTHPVSGMASKSDWLPTVREVMVECERLAAHEGARAARARQLEQQLADRAADEANEKSRTTRLTLDELRARHGENWGLTPVDEVRPVVTIPDSRLAIARECAELGIEPMYAGDMPISPSLLRALGRMVPRAMPPSGGGE